MPHALSKEELTQLTSQAVQRIQAAIMSDHDTPDAMLQDLIGANVFIAPPGVPWPFADNFAFSPKDVIGNVVHLIPNVFQQLATPEGKKWVKDHIEDLLDYLATLSTSQF